MLFFILGLIVGSFLNVVIYRLNHHDSPFRGRSYCPECRHTLVWYDLVPLFSFLSLGGKCRYCKTRISWQYPVVEVAAGLGFGVISQIGQIGLIGQIWLIILFSGFVVIFVSDWLYQIIPDAVVFPMLLAQSVKLVKFGQWENLGAGVLGAGFFLGLVLITRGRGMGLGDAKLAFLIGLLVGVSRTILAVWLSFVLGTFYVLPLLLLKKKRFGETIAFGPFLILGLLVSCLWGERILATLWWK